MEIFRVQDLPYGMYVMKRTSTSGGDVRVSAYTLSTEVCTLFVVQGNR